MTDIFDHAVKNVLDHEGAYVDDPRDNGSETNWGISKRAYPMLDIKALTQNQAIDIYRRDYWEPVSGDKLPPMLAILVLDTAVNMGVATAIRLLQKAAGVTVDGILGPDTLRACHRAPEAVLADMAALRIRRYTQLATFDIYGRGWIRRVVLTVLAAVGK